MRTVTPHEYLQQIDVDNYLAHAYFASPDRLAELLGLYHPHVTTADVRRWRREYRDRAEADARKGMAVQPEEVAFLEAASEGVWQTQAQRRRAVESIAIATLRPYGCLSQIHAAIKASKTQMGRAWTLEEDAALMVNGEARRTPKLTRQRQQYLDRILRVHGEPVAATDDLQTAADTTPDYLQAAHDAFRYAVAVTGGDDHLLKVEPDPAPYMQVTPFDGATLTIEADREHLNFNGKRWTRQQVTEFAAALDFMRNAMTTREEHPEW